MGEHTEMSRLSLVRRALIVSLSVSLLILSSVVTASADSTCYSSSVGGRGGTTACGIPHIR
jgi:hypothetical protein